jgi:pimeloyl-ACP methyl ester carboxylesterase
MDQVRQALAVPRVSYLGFSYGTELGSAYAHLFPTRVRVAVLDGAVDPLMSGLRLLTAQMQGFEAAFDQFAEWCARRSPCSDIGNARRAAERILAAAARAPLQIGARRLSATLADIGIAQALYARALWPRLADALLQARRGSGTGLLALADEYYQRQPDGRYVTNLFDAYNVISCNDAPPGPTDAQLRSSVRLWVRRFPLFGKWSAQQLFMCQRWPVTRTVPPRPTAPTDTRVLVVGNIHDPATPYQGARDLARTMGNAQVLTWNGEGHTSYLHGSSCVDRYVNDYLIRADLPPDGTVCRR